MGCASKAGGNDGGPNVGLTTVVGPSSIESATVSQLPFGAPWWCLAALRDDVRMFFKVKVRR